MKPSGGLKGKVIRQPLGLQNYGLRDGEGISGGKTQEGSLQGPSPQRRELSRRCSKFKGRRGEGPKGARWLIKALVRLSPKSFVWRGKTGRTAAFSCGNRGTFSEGVGAGAAGSKLRVSASKRNACKENSPEVSRKKAA